MNEDDFDLLLLIEEFYPNISGGALTRWNFCKKLKEKGKKIAVITLKNENTKKHEKIEGIDIFRPIGEKSKNFRPYSYFGMFYRLFISIYLFFYIYFWLKKHNIKGIHSTSYMFHWIGKIHARQEGVDIVNFIGYTPSLDSESSLNIQSILERINLELFMGSTIFCRTKETKKNIEEFIDTDVKILHGILDKKKIIETINEVDVKEIKNEYGIEKDDIFLLFVGRLHPIKSPIELVKIMKELSEKYKLLVIGEGPESKKLKEKITKNKLEKQIEMLGEISHKKTLQIIASCDSLILTSNKESYGGVVLEALSFSKTVFSTPVGILKEVKDKNLHLGETEKFSNMIKETNGEFNLELNHDILEKYSMERYTEKIISSMDY